MTTDQPHIHWHRLASLLSVIGVLIVALAYLWWGKFHYHHQVLLNISFLSAIGIMVGNHWLHGDRLRDLGLARGTLRPAAFWFGITTITVCTGIALAGLAFGEFHPPTWTGTGTYFLWAAAQQYVLQNFLVLRSTEIFGSRHGKRSWKGIGVSAAWFGLVHLPNLKLALLSGAGALLWSSLFRRFPSLFWVTISQALITTFLLAFFKYGFLAQFEVGMGGYRYDFYGTGAKVAGGIDSQGTPFVATLPGPDKGTRALVRIFDVFGQRQFEWEAFEDLDFSGEISVGDLGYQAGDEVVVAAGPGSGNPPQVRVFTPDGQLLSDFTLKPLDFGYGARVSVACGQLFVTPGPAPWAPAVLLEVHPDGSIQRSWSFQELGLVNGIRGTGLCGGSTGARDPSVSRLLLWGSEISINPSTLFLCDRDSGRINSFETISTTFGAQVAVLSLQSGRKAIAVAPGPLEGYPPLTAIFTPEGQELQRLSPYGTANNHGANLGTVDVDGDGQDELIFGQGIGPGQPGTVRIYRLDGSLVTWWDAYEP